MPVSSIALLSVSVTVAGVMFGSVWQPGPPLVSLGTISVGCLIGGLSLWTAILAIGREGQEVWPYEPKPRGVSGAEILKWSKRTKLKSFQRVRLPVVGYVVLLLVFLFVTHFDLPPSGVDVAHVAAIIVYVIFGFGAPGYFMEAGF